MCPGFPATGARSLLQNSSADIEVFFRRNHMNQWLIINCCNHKYTLEGIVSKVGSMENGWS